MAFIDRYLQKLVETGASDLHLSQGQPPKMRLHGAIRPIDDFILDGESLEKMLGEICDEQPFKRYLQRGDLDFAYEMDSDSRFRFQGCCGRGRRLTGEARASDERTAGCAPRKARMSPSRTMLR